MIKARILVIVLFFFFQAEVGIRDLTVTGVQTCALPISLTGGSYVTGIVESPHGVCWLKGEPPAPSMTMIPFTRPGLASATSQPNGPPAECVKIGRASCRERV